MTVRNLESSRGNLIPNQFAIRNDGITYFQSYDSIIVKIEPGGQIYLDEYYWDYSRTTSKYRNIFLGNTTKECLENISNGTYKLENLN